ncbi:MAG: hypothetical protein FWC20_02745 [Oscillospiraceae bacterium]|nr:hypothetical protein [Oscillospiraceae bacterium]
MSKVDMSVIEEMVKKGEYEYCELLSKLEKLERESSDKERKFDIVRYQLLADEARTAKLHDEIKHLKQKGEKDKRKHKRKYEKMQLELLRHIVRLQSQLVKDDDSKILDIAKYL